MAGFRRTHGNYTRLPPSGDAAKGARREVRIDSTPMRDTLPEAEVVRREAVRRLDPCERLRQALELSDLLLRLRRAGRTRAQGESEHTDPARSG